MRRVVAGMEGVDGGDMRGMMNEAEMQALGDAEGTDWDQMFLTMMIEHHEGAVEMAPAEITTKQGLLDR